MGFSDKYTDGPKLGILSDEAIKMFQEMEVIPKGFDISDGFIIECLDKDTKDIEDA